MGTGPSRGGRPRVESLLRELERAEDLFPGCDELLQPYLAEDLLEFGFGPLRRALGVHSAQALQRLQRVRSTLLRNAGLALLANSEELTHPHAGHTPVLDLSKHGQRCVLGAPFWARSLETLRSRTPQELFVQNRFITTASAVLASGFPQLRCLCAGFNGGLDLAAMTQGLRELVYLEVGHNSIGDEGAALLARELRHLTSLGVALNDIQPAGAIAIAQSLPQLLSLDIGDNYVGSAGAAAIAEGLTRLTHLVINKNDIRDEGLAAIAGGLQQLVLLNVASDGIMPEGAVALAHGLPELRFLFISNNCIGDEGAAALARLQRLWHLQASRNDIGSEGLVAISRIRSLVALDISANDVEAEGVAALRALRRLRVLDLRKTPVPPPPAVVFLPSLRVLKKSGVDLDALRAQYGVEWLERVQARARLVMMVPQLPRYLPPHLVRLVGEHL